MLPPSALTLALALVLVLVLVLVLLVLVPPPSPSFSSRACTAATGRVVAVVVVRCFETRRLEKAAASASIRCWSRASTRTAASTLAAFEGDVDADAEPEAERADAEPELRACPWELDLDPDPGAEREPDGDTIPANSASRETTLADLTSPRPTASSSLLSPPSAPAVAPSSVGAATAAAAASFALITPSIRSSDWPFSFSTVGLIR